MEGVNWRYWDLGLLINALLLDNPLPENVQAYRGYFDVVMVVLGDYRTHLEELVAKFLTKPGGKYFF